MLMVGFKSTVPILGLSTMLRALFHGATLIRPILALALAIQEQYLN